MAEDFDSRLLESAKPRKSRLDDAFLFGKNLQERSYSTLTARLMQSLLVAALIAAICVGFSFVQHLLSEQAANRQSAVSLGNAQHRRNPMSTALSRVTIIAAHRHLDVRLPSDEPIASLCPNSCSS